MSHSPEPWRIEPETGICEDGPSIRDANNDVVIFTCCADCRGGEPVVKADDAKRLVACVNACRGVSSENLEAVAQGKCFVLLGRNEDLLKRLMNMKDQKIEILPVCEKCGRPLPKETTNASRT